MWKLWNKRLDHKATANGQIIGKFWFDRSGGEFPFM